MGSILNHCGTLLFAAILLTVLVAGCGNNQETAAKKVEAAAEDVSAESAGAEVAVSLTSAEEALVTKMAAIAIALEESPAAAGAILEKNSLTIDEYEAEIYKIASNPALSAAFEKAKNR